MIVCKLLNEAIRAYRRSNKQYEVGAVNRSAKRKCKARNCINENADAGVRDRGTDLYENGNGRPNSKETKQGKQVSSKCGSKENRKQSKYGRHF